MRAAGRRGANAPVVGASSGAGRRSAAPTSAAKALADASTASPRPGQPQRLEPPTRPARCQRTRRRRTRASCDPARSRDRPASHRRSAPAPRSDSRPVPDRKSGPGRRAAADPRSDRRRRSPGRRAPPGTAPAARWCRHRTSRPTAPPIGPGRDRAGAISSAGPGPGPSSTRCGPEVNRSPGSAGQDPVGAAAETEQLGQLGEPFGITRPRRHAGGRPARRRGRGRGRPPPPSGATAR